MSSLAPRPAPHATPAALYVFFDARCGLCRACREWLARQPALIPLVFVPLQSRRARELCPSLDTFEPEKEIVVMSDTGAIYQGATSWVMCLYATVEHRALALRLAHPALLPFARKACHFLSKNRFLLSRIFRIDPRNEDLARNLEQLPEPATTCEFHARSPQSVA